MRAADSLGVCRTKVGNKTELYNFCRWKNGMKGNFARFMTGKDGVEQTNVAETCPGFFPTTSVVFLQFFGNFICRGGDNPLCTACF